MVSPAMEDLKKRLIEWRDQINAKRNAELTVEGFREATKTLSAISRLPKGIQRKKMEVKGMKALWLTPPNVRVKNTIHYLHGSGYIAGSIRTHREIAGRIALASKAQVLLIEYRLAPEHPYPAALEDAVITYQWLLDEEGIKPENLAIAGDSAGGGLTFATLLKLRDEGIALPAAAVCLSPWTDLALTGESIKSKAEDDPLLSPEALQFCAKPYLITTDARNPYVSPLYADLQGLPPILIQVGSAEIILDDSIRIAERAKAAGVDVTLEIWEGCFHIFQAFAMLAPEGMEAIEKIGAFIQRNLK